MALKNLTAATLAENDVDLSEKGRNEAGETISLDRRLFMNYKFSAASTKVVG
jgi:hypothetical protein